MIFLPKREHHYLAFPGSFQLSLFRKSIKKPLNFKAKPQNNKPTICQL